MARNEQVFLEAGRITQETGFIAQDIFVVCYFDRAGAEITTCLLKEPKFVDDLQSYQYWLPSTRYAQAVIEAQVLVLPTRNWQRLDHTVVDWLQEERNLVKRALPEKPTTAVPSTAPRRPRVAPRA